MSLLQGLIENPLPDENTGVNILYLTNPDEIEQVENTIGPDSIEEIGSRIPPIILQQVTATLDDLGRFHKFLALLNRINSYILALHTEPKYESVTLLHINGMDIPSEKAVGPSTISLWIHYGPFNNLQRAFLNIIADYFVGQYLDKSQNMFEVMDIVFENKELIHSIFETLKESHFQKTIKRVTDDKKIYYPIDAVLGTDAFSNVLGSFISFLAIVFDEDYDI